MIAVLSSKVIDSDDYLIKVKGVLVNLRSYEVHVNGELINLTSK